MTDEIERIPVIQEEARLIKRPADAERVRVRTIPEERSVVLHEKTRHEDVEVLRVPVNREVREIPSVRTEGDLMIVPVVEERLVVEKRLFLVEELHLRRQVRLEEVSVPATIRRTRVEVSRAKEADAPRKRRKAQWPAAKSAGNAKDTPRR